MHICQLKKRTRLQNKVGMEAVYIGTGREDPPWPPAEGAVPGLSEGC